MKLRVGARSGHYAEAFGKFVLYFFSGTLALAYLAALIYLVARGGAKVVSFTSFATPLGGVSGEDGYRSLVAGLLGGSVGYVVGLVGRRFIKAPAAAKWTPRGLMALVALVFIFVVRDHLPRFLIVLPSETTAGGGVGPEIFNTIYLAILSTLVTTPIGVGAAVYLARFAQSKGLRTTARIALDTLASLPSIVYGLFGFLVFVVLMHAGYSLAAGAGVLALLNLPLVVAISEEAIRHVPRDLEDASLALGATRTQTVLRVTLPYAWPGILSAVVLSIGRVFAESAPLIMTAGTTISRATAFSPDPTRGGETLAVHLWYVNSSGLSPDKDAVSAGTAAVLVILVALMNVLATRLARYGGAAGPRTKRAAK